MGSSGSISDSTGTCCSMTKTATRTAMASWKDCGTGGEAGG